MGRNGGNTIRSRRTKHTVRGAYGSGGRRRGRLDLESQLEWLEDESQFDPELRKPAEQESFKADNTGAKEKKMDMVELGNEQKRLGS